MKHILACLLLFCGLLVGSAVPAEAQHGRHGRGYGRGRGHMGPPPRAFHRGPGPRYYHAAPYRSYGGRAYYRPRPGYYRRPGPAVIIRP